MGRIRRHPVAAVATVLLLAFLASVVASAEPSERASVAGGLAIIVGLAVAAGWGVSWVWRAVTRRGRSPAAAPSPHPRSCRRSLLRLWPTILPSLFPSVA